MTYELALELKKAGFPQDPDRPAEDWITMPTLSELIEACGDRFDNLRRIYDGSFAAESIGKEPQGGDTPEEAVANLWLLLNKK